MDAVISIIPAEVLEQNDSTYLRIIRRGGLEWTPYHFQMALAGVLLTKKWDCDDVESLRRMRAVGFS
jgi:hypothetical protein